MSSFSLERFLGKKSTWEFLKEVKQPIFIYGMGDGALKILSQFDKFNIPCAGIFASDEFVRGHYFEGHKVHKLTEIEDVLDDFVIVLAFAAGYDSLLEKIAEISQRHILLAPDVPVFGGGLFTKEFLIENFDKAEAVYNMLADEQSKEVFAKTIEYKITGDITLLNEISTPISEAFENIIKLGDNESYVDAGAYNGDTVLDFIEMTKGKYEKIFALEPNVRNFKKLTKSVKGHENIECHNVACWNEDTLLTFADKAGRQSAVSKKGVETVARSIDSILGGERASFIKYDVEGAEAEALDGTEKTIKAFSPALQVALYHRNEDIFDLPLKVSEMNPHYKLYMRKAPYIPAWEVNLFAVL